MLAINSVSCLVRCRNLSDVARTSFCDANEPDGELKSGRYKWPKGKPGVGNVWGMDTFT